MNDTHWHTHARTHTHTTHSLTSPPSLPCSLTNSHTLPPSLTNSPTHSTLAFEKSQTMFRVGRPPFQPLIRNISLANHFNVPLVLYDIRLSSKAQDYFSVSTFSSCWSHFVSPSLPLSLCLFHSNSACLAATCIFGGLVVWSTSL